MQISKFPFQLCISGLGLNKGKIPKLAFLEPKMAIFCFLGGTGGGRLLKHKCWCFYLDQYLYLMNEWDIIEEDLMLSQYLVN